jgi:signal transduction histidine kinase
MLHGVNFLIAIVFFISLAETNFLERLNKYNFLVFFVCILTGCFQTGKNDIENKKYRVPNKHSLIAKGNLLWDRSKLDSAFMIFDQAREMSIKTKDSFNLAIALNSMGMIATELGDSFNGLEYSIEALKYLRVTRKEDLPYLVSNLNNLGITSYDLKKYADAINFYRQAIPFIIDTNYLHTTKNNLGNAYRELKKYQTAIRFYKEVLVNDPSEENMARTLTNLAKAKMLENKDFNPIPLYLKALEVRNRTRDNWGKNSSYSHLADYYLNIKSDSALYYSRLMYHLSLALKNPDNELEALAKMAELEPSNRLNYFRRYRQLGDSLTEIRNTAKNQFALIRYNTEKHKAENLRLEKENEQKKSQLARRNTLLIIAIFIILATVSISIAVLRLRKRRLIQRSEQQIKESKLKTSKEIHDVVANGLYRMMSEVEYTQEINKSKLIGQIEQLYNQSRQISHAVSANPMEFIERINELIHSFSNQDIKIMTVGLEEKLNIKLSVPIKDEVILAIQELLVNMKKHSDATQVVLRFELWKDKLEIQYRDNGQGLSTNSNKGAGLRNTESRIAVLKGLFIFGNHTISGLQATIQIPLI